ncbi:putative transcription factor GRF family [Arabidopsis thaliana]
MSLEISSVGEEGSGNCGFPSKCRCGRDVVIYTSSSKKNPGRPYFRCPTYQDDHLFKWVEDCVYEEVVDAIPRISIIDSEVNNAKSEVAVEIAELKGLIQELKEDEMWSKRELKRWKSMTKVCLVCLCIIFIAIVIIMFYKTKNEELVLGY